MSIARGAALDAFLDRLRDEKFVIGVDRVLLVERILKLHGDQLTPPELRSRLRPVLVSSPEQQVQFDKLYGEWFLADWVPPIAEVVAVKPLWPWLWMVEAVLLLGCLFASAWQWLHRYDVPPPPPPRIEVYEDGVATSRYYWGRPVLLELRVESVSAPSRSRLGNSLVLSVRLPAPAVKKTDPFTLPPAPLGITTGRDRWTHTATVNITDITPIRWLMLLLGPAFFYIFYRYWQRRMILDRFRNQDKAFQYNIHPLKLDPDAHAEDDIRTAIRALRRPAEGHPRLSIPQSIDATIRNGGAPALRYASTRRRPEYLILIDTLASRDHQSTLFQSMVRSMDKKGLQVYAYLYAGDPRVCRPMPGVTKGRVKTLADLVAGHTDARLLLFGDAGQLFYEQSSDVQPWVKRVFEQWPERTIFTPKSVREWSDREQELEKGLEFRLLPALQKNLSSFVHAESAFAYYEPAWEYADATSLKKDLGDEVYAWLAACALYPRLEWILTMRLGRALGLYSEEGRLRLVRLPWFRQGEMPVELQQELYESMSPQQLRKARGALQKLLEEAKKSEPNAAEGLQSTEFEIAVQKEGASPAERREIRRDLAIARGEVAGDKDSWRLYLSAKVRQLLLLDSRRMSRLNWLLGSVVLGIGLVGALWAVGTVGSAKIEGAYLGPTAPDGLEYEVAARIDAVVANLDALSRVLWLDGDSNTTAGTSLRYAGQRLIVALGPLDLPSTFSSLLTEFGKRLGDDRRKGLQDAGAIYVRLGQFAEGLPKAGDAQRKLSRSQVAEMIALLRREMQDLRENALNPQAVPPAGTVRVNPKDGLKYVYIPAGRFMMGCSPGDKECEKDETPHEVQISKGFWLGQTEVTNEAYDRFKDGKTPADKKQLPKLEVSWDEAKAYCEWSGGRLPTEAEWEYAARAGSTEARYGALDAVAWYSDNSKGAAHPAGKKVPNAWGLYDMLGNAWEWNQDWFGDYPGGPQSDPQGPATGQYRVLRGGAWDDFPNYARASRRDFIGPMIRNNNTGFRCRR